MNPTIRAIILGLAAVWLAVGAATTARAQTPPADDSREKATQDELKRLQGILLRAESTFVNRQEVAAVLLGKRTGEADAILVEALANREIEDVPLAVLKAIAAAGAPADGAFLPALLTLAAGETVSPKVAQALPTAIAVCRDKDTVAELVRRIGESARTPEKVILINALGLTGEKQAVGPLIDLLKSPAEAVRSAAAGALREITLVDGFGESHEKWSRWWQEHRGEPRDTWLALQIKALRNQVIDHRAQIQQQAALIALLGKRLVEADQRRLQGLGPEQRLPEVVKLLDDPLPALRRLAAREARKLLAEMKELDEALVGKLLARLGDEAPEVRSEIARALAAVSDQRAGDALLKRLREEADADVMAALISALGEMPEPRAVDELIKLLQGGREPLVIHAAGALARIGDRSSPAAEAVGPAIPVLCKLLSGNGDAPAPPAVREAVVRALAQIGRKETRGSLIKALDDSEARVRFYAAQGLGNIPDLPEGDGAAIDALLVHLSDADKGVRFAVANALGKLGNGKVRRAIAAQLAPTSSEKDAEVRAALWRALVAIERRQSDPRATETLADEFAAYGDRANLTWVIQLYEIAVAKLAGGAGNGHLVQLNTKLADAYMAGGQAAKAADILRELVRKAAADDPSRAPLERKLGEALLEVPPFVEGAGLLARAAREAAPEVREALLKLISDRARKLQSENRVAEARGIVAHARKELTAGWAGSPSADRMETLMLTLTRALFDRAADTLGSDDETTRRRAEADVQRLAGELPDLLLGRLQTALETNKTDRAAQLEKFLPAVREDVSAYTSAKTPQEKLDLVRQWRKGDGNAGEKDSPEPKE